LEAASNDEVFEAIADVRRKPTFAEIPEAGAVMHPSRSALKIAGTPEKWRHSHDENGETRRLRPEIDTSTLVYSLNTA
jgi:hypothetical protein